MASELTREVLEALAGGKHWFTTCRQKVFLSLAEPPLAAAPLLRALATEVLAARARMAELEASLDTERYRHGHLSRCKSRYSDRWSDSPDCDCGYDRRDAAYFTELAAEATASADWTPKAPSGEEMR